VDESTGLCVKEFVCSLFPNRPVRTRTPGGVGRAGQMPALTRLE
jgi:hypothetical protein